MVAPRFESIVTLQPARLRRRRWTLRILVALGLLGAALIGLGALANGGLR